MPAQFLASTPVPLRQSRPLSMETSSIGKDSKGDSSSSRPDDNNLVSMDDKFHSAYEPFSAPPSERLKALRHCHDLRLKTWVSLEPYPTPNIVDQDLKELLKKVAFVDKMIFGRWNYSPEVNGHQGIEKFYRDCSKTVSEFCHKKKIVLHIKQGTPMSTKKSNGLFHED